MTTTAAPAPAPGPVLPGPGPGLWRRPFVLLAVGQAVSRLGDGLFATVLVWIALQARGRAGVAVVATAAAAPMLAGSLAGASYADRHDRRRLMIAADLIRLVLLLALAAVLAGGRVPLPALAAFALAEGSAAAVFTPARLALVPAVVPAGSLLRANGILQACFMASFGLGPLLAGPLLAVTTIPGVVAVNAATFAVSAATVAGIRPAWPAAHPGPGADLGMRRDVAAGWRAVRAAPDVLLVLATFTAALVLASGLLAVGLPAWVARAHGGPGTLGLLQGTAWRRRARRGARAEPAAAAPPGGGRHRRLGGARRVPAVPSARPAGGPPGCR